jgi:hypothetical protein
MIQGQWVNARPGNAKWLKVKWPGGPSGFIWGRDLSQLTRPTLVSVGPGPKAATIASLAYSEPDEKAAVVDDVSPGEMAATVGTTGDGWTEIALNAGGVGYLKSTAFEQADPDVARQSAEAMGITHYVCTFAPDQSVNPPSKTGQLSFYLDTRRQCINHRYPYFPDAAGGLKRVMLNDKAHRASLLYFMPDRKAFYRTDYTLTAQDYGNLLRKNAVLEGMTCPPPNDPAAATSLQATLERVSPNIDAQTPNVSWRRRVWQCEVVQAVLKESSLSHPAAMDICNSGSPLACLPPSSHPVRFRNEGEANAAAARNINDRLSTTAGQAQAVGAGASGRAARLCGIIASNDSSPLGKQLAAQQLTTYGAVDGRASAACLVLARAFL